MSAVTKIQWTDHTFNPWIGCTKVSDGCKHCYAESLDRRWGHARWGAGAKRERTSATYWKQPLKWNRAAQKAGVRRRVFCASLADVFDADVPEEWRAELWGLIAQTPSLDWQLLTKRPENIRRMLPPAWPWLTNNVWFGATVENQDAADKRIPELLEIPAALRFLSVEPQIGPVDFNLCPAWHPGIHGIYLEGIDWVIVGGESGHGARAFDIDWARQVRDQCKSAGVACFVKQLGAKAFEHRPAEGRPAGVDFALENLGTGHPQRKWFSDWTLVHHGASSEWYRYHQATDSKGGDWSEWPADLRVRDFPEVHR